MNLMNTDETDENGVGTEQTVGGPQWAETDGPWEGMTWAELRAEAKRQMMYDDDSLMWNRQGRVYLETVVEWVTFWCDQRNVPASHRRRILGAVVHVLDCEPLGDAIYGLMQDEARKIFETMAHCSMDSPDPEAAVYIEMGDYVERIGLPELIQEADWCLENIEEEILASPEC